MAKKPSEQTLADTPWVSGENEPKTWSEKITIVKEAYETPNPIEYLKSNGTLWSNKLATGLENGQSIETALMSLGCNPQISRSVSVGTRGKIKETFKAVVETLKLTDKIKQDSNLGAMYVLWAGLIIAFINWYNRDWLPGVAWAVAGALAALTLKKTWEYTLELTKAKGTTALMEACQILVYVKTGLPILEKQYRSNIAKTFNKSAAKANPQDAAEDLLVKTMMRINDASHKATLVYATLSGLAVATYIIFVVK